MAIVEVDRAHVANAVRRRTRLVLHFVDGSWYRFAPLNLGTAWADRLVTALRRAAG